MKRLTFSFSILFFCASPASNPQKHTDPTTQYSKQNKTCACITTYALCPILCPIALAKTAIKQHCSQAPALKIGALLSSVTGKQLLNEPTPEKMS